MSRTVLASIAMIVAFAVTAFAQDSTKPTNGSPVTDSAAAATAAAPAIAITPETTPKDLARAAFMAQGGEKFRAVQNTVRDADGCILRGVQREGSETEPAVG